MLLKAVQSPSPIPLFVAQRSEDIIKREPAPHTLISLRPDVPSMPCTCLQVTAGGLMQLPCQDGSWNATLPWKGGLCRLCCPMPDCSPHFWLMLLPQLPEPHAGTNHVSVIGSAAVPC